MNVILMLIEESEFQPKIYEEMDNKMLMMVAIHDARMRYVVKRMSLDALEHVPTKLPELSYTIKRQCIQAWEDLKSQYEYSNRHKQLMTFPLGDNRTMKSSIKIIIPPLFLRDNR